MKIPFVDLHAQYLSIKSEIDAAMADVMAESAFIRGPHVDAFEKAWADDPRDEALCLMRQRHGCHLYRDARLGNAVPATK